MIRASHPLRLHVARHAEAIKNVEKRHGGGDQRLTPRGEGQAARIGYYLLEAAGVETGNANVIYQPEGRSEATARHIGEVILPRRVDLRTELVGIDLGARNGLSESELEERFPEVSAALAEWRRNKGFRVPEVPGGEHLEDFAERVRRALIESINSSDEVDDLVVVATTSSLVMVHHLLSQDGNLSAPDYEFVDMPLASVSTWQLSDTERPLQLTNMVVPQER